MEKNLKKYNDMELITLLKSNSSISDLAFKEIYDRYSSNVNAYCMRVYNNQELAEDVFQETFIRFYQSIKKKSNDIEETPLLNFNIPGLLITISRNYILNLKRKENKEVVVESFDYFEYDTQNYENQELLDLIKKALVTLDFDYREAFVMREYNGISYEEIAKITNISVSNAKARVFRAKQKIREILKPYLVDINKI